MDNNSTDATRERVRRDYPEVQLVENVDNVGFLVGTNQGIARSVGRYILWLNPDTLLRPDSLRQMVDFLEQHPKAGIVGPRVLNADGSFQPQCKRGMPTPAASLCYMLHIDRLLPNHPTAGQYLLRGLPDDQPNQVDAVSGCCLMTRRTVVEHVGPLDEELKQWGEDIEWCVRAHKMGWEVWYYPNSVITHLKGQSSRHNLPYRAARDMHTTMWLFYKKYFQPQSSPVTSAAVRAGIAGSLGLALSRIWISRHLRPRKK